VNREALISDSMTLNQASAEAARPCELSLGKTSKEVSEFLKHS